MHSALHKRVEKIQSFSFEEVKNDKKVKVEFLNICFLLFGATPCASCSSKMFDYYKMIKEKGMAKVAIVGEKSKSFKFKDNVVGVPMTFGSSDILTPDTLTDERVVLFLRANRNRIKLFKTFPSNWEELLEVKKVVKPKKEKAIDVINRVKEEMDIDVLKALMNEDKRVSVLKAISARLGELNALD